MNIAIVTDTPFPIGFAATNRILSYCKGFESNGKKITIYIIKPTESENGARNTTNNGKIGSCNYQYTVNSVRRSKSFLKRRFFDAFGYIRLLYILPKRKPDAVIVYFNSLLKEFFLLLLLKILKIKSLKEESEYLEVYFKNKLLPSSIYGKLYWRFVYRKYDVLLLMTNYLIDKFRLKLGRSTPKIIHVPMTVDLSRFDNLRKNSDEFYITYIGLLNEKKDGVFTLLKAFHKISLLFEEPKLMLIGSPVDEYFKREIYEYVQINDLSERVIFVGSLPSTEMPQYLADSSILALTRPNSLQAEGGFPTKLGEYLASARPVLVTSVGDIPKYLSDGINAFIVEPDTVDAIVEKLQYIIKNYSKSLEIGIEGKKTACTFFNSDIQVKNIIEQLESID
jgi:glycosyltransferase involved in cell wall biosynthesis